ncbi:MAG: serine/threonine protein kinase, partial [Labilithrix sp.]|nr:serine/threonine protein kinase [Labilithrix sp.]
MANQKSKGGDDGGPNARVGSVIKGKWKIESLLGVGGMAAVYAASHRNGQRAALKILHTDFAREKTICERFLREAYVSNKVNHGATVQVLDDDMTESGEPFLIMELLEGETVRDAWKKSGRTMPGGRVLQICERVLDCLASCHAIKVIHRDLKPANIFILKEDEIRVLDFGVAQMRDATSERTATGTALGTPAYMSPEQAMGLVDQLDGRADLFSVGAMMHALITGHRINNGRTEQEALVMAATKPVPSVARLAPQLPIELIKVIDKSLAWDRRNRYQDAREMQKALLELMPGQSVLPLVGRPAPRPQEVVAPPA